MCTSIVSNRKKTIIGWNLDILNMEYRVISERDKVYIAIHDATEGWLPLFGANACGDFVTMPTCWPHDERSNPTEAECRNIILLNIDLLLGKKTLEEIKAIAEREPIFSIPGLTFQSQLSDREGNVLQIVPGQGMRYLPKPPYSVMTNFSPFKGNTPEHPWMGWDRYCRATEILEGSCDDFDVADCFDILRQVSQTVCPTEVSMVFDVTERTVYWCEKRQWDRIQQQKINL